VAVLYYIITKQTTVQDCSCLPVLQLGPNSIVALDHIRLLGVMFSSDLSLDRCLHHQRVQLLLTTVCQLQHSRGSLDTESVATFVYSSHQALTIAMLSWQVCRKRRTTNCRLLNTAVHVVSGKHKFDRGLCNFSIPSYIGSVRCVQARHHGCSIACILNHLLTSRNCANQSYVSHRGIISDLSPDISMLLTQHLWLTGFLCGLFGIPCRTHPSLG